MWLPSELRRFRAARLWSNQELKKFAPHVKGQVVNVSGWQDKDKQGATYRDYFSNCQEYWITNWKSEARGFQGGQHNEIYLDLEGPLPQNLVGRFDVVFNHTTLEHVFDVFTAFSNICKMSRDRVIIVVPFIQEQHSDYGDYWRFTPWGIKRLFEANDFSLAYISFNDKSKEAMYLFAIGVNSLKNYDELVKHPHNKLNELYSSIGSHMFSLYPAIDKLLRIFFSVHAFFSLKK